MLGILGVFQNGTDFVDKTKNQEKVRTDPLDAQKLPYGILLYKHIEHFLHSLVPDGLQELRLRGSRKKLQRAFANTLFTAASFVTARVKINF